MNKGDLPGADQAYETLSLFTRERKSDAWEVPVILSEGINGKGIDRLRDAVYRHQQYITGSRGRVEKDVQLTLSIVKEEFWKFIEQKRLNDPEVMETIMDVRNGRMDPYSAVQKMLEMVDVKIFS